MKLVLQCYKLIVQSVILVITHYFPRLLVVSAPCFIEQFHEFLHSPLLFFQTCIYLCHVLGLLFPFLSLRPVERLTFTG